MRERLKVIKSDEVILGIDPGLDGAFFFLDFKNQSGVVFDMPTFEIERGGKNKRDINISEVLYIVGYRKVIKAFIEISSSMPGQGVTSMHTSGIGYGILLCALTAKDIPYEKVSARVWKKEFKLSKAKDASRAKISELLPRASHLFSRVMDHNRAESALIAIYGSRRL